MPRIDHSRSAILSPARCRMSRSQSERARGGVSIAIAWVMLLMGVSMAMASPATSETVRITYTLDYVAAANGRVLGAAQQVVDRYASGSFVTAVPDSRQGALQRPWRWVT